MKPPPFRYVAARDRAEALALLHDAGTAAKILAGGQSLVPMLNFRLLRPSIVLDINRIAGLADLHASATALHVGALVRHRTIETSPVVAAHIPLLAAATAQIAHVAVRNRGTFCGSLCHADPAAEPPLLALLLDARIGVASASGTRQIAADAFFVSALTTSLAPDELVTGVELPLLPHGTGWGFAELARREGDFALCAVAVTLRAEAGCARDVRIAIAGVADRPLRAIEAAAELEGRAWTPASLRRAADAARAAVAPISDLHASGEYRRRILGVLIGRAATQAWQRALDGGLTPPASDDR